jgi:tRNA A-37 threonylcarbamoyl transferase component Bud32
MLKAGVASQTGEAGPGGTLVLKAPAPIPKPEDIAAHFPQLEILECLGRGGMGAVYKARQPKLDRFVALKILTRNREDGTPDAEFAERFQREARALARLHHPNIVSIHDFGEAGGYHFLLMEYVDGLTLRQLLQSRKLSPEEALAIVPKICDALQYAHQQGIVHRDIKPENILLDKQGQLKIADFGIAKIIGQTPKDGSLTGARDVIGTPHYMAPEQVEKPQTVDHRADIYSLGVVFYEMLTGELPLGKFAPPSRKVEVDVRLDEVVLHALEKEPARRYQQAGQVKTDLETIAGTAPLAAGFAAGAGAAPQPAATPARNAASDKTILPAFLLAFFFGVFGAHRFYVGKTGTAILQLVTFGACGIWAMIDWILILCKAFTDGQGRRITKWIHPDTGASKPEAEATAGTPPTLASGVASSASANGKEKIIAPAVGLMVAGGLKLFSALAGMFFLASLNTGWLEPLFEDLGIGSFSHWNVPASFSLVLFKVVPALLILFGALQMMQLRSYAWAIAAGILAIVSCSLIGFPVGIWALVVLSRPDVRQAFEAPAASRPVNAGKWPWVAVVTVVLIALFVAALACSLLLRSIFHVGSAANGVSGKPFADASGISRVVVSGQRALIEGQGSTDFRIVFSVGSEQNSWRCGFPNDTHFTATIERGQRGINCVVKDSDGNMLLSSTETTVGLAKFDPGRMVFRDGTLAPEPDGAFIIADYQPGNGAPIPFTVRLENIRGLSMERTLPLEKGGGASNTPVTNGSSGVGSNNPSVLSRNTFTLNDAAETIAKSFAVEPGGKLAVETDQGDIHVVTSDQNKVEVLVKREVTHASESEAGRILRNHQVTLIQNGDEIRVHAKSPNPGHNFWSWLGLRPDLNVHLQLTVPRRFDVTLHTAGGDISVENVQGQVETTTSGGDLNLSKIQGPVLAHTSGGNIQAADCAGDLQIHTSGGDIQIKNFTGPMIRAETSGGDVSLDLAGQPQSNCLLHTSGGKVTARIPETIALYLDANTSGGEVSAEIPVRVEGKQSASVLRGTINGGGPVLTLQTSGGDIHVLKR